MSGVAFYSVCAMAFAYSPSFWLAILLLCGMGVGDTISAVLRGTINQLVAPDHLRGRVSAVNPLFTNGGPPLGQFESGLVADWWGAQMSAFTGGLATLIFVGGVASAPALRHFTLPSVAPEPARA